MNVVPSGMPSDKPLITLVMEPELIEQIEDFQFSQRFRSRAAAMKWLMQAALKAGLVPKPGEVRHTPRWRQEPPAASEGR